MHIRLVVRGIVSAIVALFRQNASPELGLLSLRTGRIGAKPCAKRPIRLRGSGGFSTWGTWPVPEMTASYASGNDASVSYACRTGRTRSCFAPDRAGPAQEQNPDQRALPPLCRAVERRPGDRLLGGPRAFGHLRIEPSPHAPLVDQPRILVKELEQAARGLRTGRPTIRVQLARPISSHRVRRCRLRQYRLSNQVPSAAILRATAPPSEWPTRIGRLMPSLPIASATAVAMPPIE